MNRRDFARICATLGIGISVIGGRMKTTNNFTLFAIPLGAEWLHTGVSLLDEIVNDSTVSVTTQTQTYSPNDIGGLWNGSSKSPADSAYFRDVCDATNFMLDNNLKVTLNTDDPGIFDLNYLADIYRLAQSYLGLSKSEISSLARNSFEILWINQGRKDRYLEEIDSYLRLSGKL